MDDATFTLEIIRPFSTQTHTVAWAQVQGPNGSFLIGPGHSSLISLLKSDGEITYKKDDGDEVTEDIFGGVIRVSGDKAVIMLSD